MFLSIFDAMKLKFVLLLSILFSTYILGFCQENNKSITAYIFVAEECPICNANAKSLQKAAEMYSDQVDFIMVFPQKMSNYKTMALFSDKYELDQIKVVLDQDQSITKKYNAKVTPEVVIVNADDKILYRGRINDQYAAVGRMRHGKVKEELQKAIQLIINGNSVPKPWPKPIGCFITIKHG